MDREKIPVGVVGATGIIGQKLVELLAEHPWFNLTALVASARSIGRTYREALQGNLSPSLPKEIGEFPITSVRDSPPCRLIFSAIEGSIAKEIEKAFALSGYWVVSNSSGWRLEPQIPLLIPEINPEHLALLDQQSFGKGHIITNPNCVVTGICLALKPLDDQWGIEKLHITTMQSLSGAGYPGVASLDAFDNVIPFIQDEEDKVEREPKKIFGKISSSHLLQHTMRISAQCNRIPITYGHMASVSIKLKKRSLQAEIIKGWENFRGTEEVASLPSAPSRPLIYLPSIGMPQPKLHRLEGKGMQVSIGGLRPCPLLDWKFTVLSHNTIRGGAGAAIINAELLAKQGRVV